MNQAAPFTTFRLAADWREIDHCKKMIAALDVAERDLARLRAELAEAKRTGSTTPHSLLSHYAALRQDIDELHRLANEHPS